MGAGKKAVRSLAHRRGANKGVEALDEVRPVGGKRPPAASSEEVTGTRREIRMKVLVAYDGQGKIVSITESPVGGGRQNDSQPLAREGHAVAELEVPTEHAYLSLAGIGQRLRIDIQSAKPTLISQ
jgi:hypothetical protein